MVGPQRGKADRRETEWILIDLARCWPDWWNFVALDSHKSKSWRKLKRRRSFTDTPFDGDSREVRYDQETNREKVSEYPRPIERWTIDALENGWY
jgi:hypothetical protein